MPLASLTCDCLGEGESLPLDEFLELHGKRRERCGFTYELLSSMIAEQQDRGEKVTTTSITAKCDRQRAISAHMEFTSNPKDLFASWRGTMVHYVLEGHAHPRAYAEARFVVRDIRDKLGDLRIPDGADPQFSGSPDLVDPGAGIVFDYKKTKEVPRFDQPWKDHVAQLNINRWLVDHADYVTYQEQEYDLTDPSVRSFFVPVDWQELIIVYLDDRGPKPLTVTKSIEVPAKKGGTKRARVPEIWTDEDVEALLRKRYPQAKRAVITGRAPVPEGWEFASHPLCNFCPAEVKKECLRRQVEDMVEDRLEGE